MQNKELWVPSKNKLKPGMIILLILWGGALFASLAGLWWYKTRPGQMDLARSEWPKNVSGLSLSTKPLTLVMFLHPKCECSDASLNELLYIMKGSEKRLEAQIDIYFPQKKNVEWAHGALWEKATALPGTSLIPDKGGRIAYLFGARTSGETYLFNSNGRLLFHGGITESRGHIGESPGRRAIASIVSGKKPDATITHPFGCALFSAGEYAALGKLLRPAGGVN